MSRLLSALCPPVPNRLAPCAAALACAYPSPSALVHVATLLLWLPLAGVGDLVGLPERMGGWARGEAAQAAVGTGLGPLAWR